MYFNFKGLPSIVLTLVLCLSLPLEAQAGKKKAIKISEPQKITEPEKVVPQKQKWSEEPTSFLGISLNEPLTVELKSPIDDFTNPVVSKDESGNVVQVQTKIKDGVIFKEVEDMMISKYGQPHSRTTGKVKTQGGQEFDNQILDWSGENVSIHVESLYERWIEAGHLWELGVVSVRTNSFIAKQKDDANRAAKDAASKL